MVTHLHISSSSHPHILALTPIFLTGFMGSGKSRIGRELAALLGTTFIDLDRLIEKRIGPITPYFQREGERSFREVERDVLLEQLALRDVVIATGGGTPFQFDNMDRMKAAGNVVCLDVPLATLVERLKRTGRDRPLLFGLDDAALEANVAALHGARIADYRRAHIVVDADAEPAVVAERIRLALA